jgi:hypothetical protein
MAPQGMTMLLFYLQLEMKQNKIYSLLQFNIC